ncbi:unnamed protein product, partial [Choristocarpus tenellus]
QAVENLLRFKQGNVVSEGSSEDILSKVTGEWRLLYTSSNAMEYNQVGSLL